MRGCGRHPREHSSCVGKSLAVCPGEVLRNRHPHPGGVKRGRKQMRYPSLPRCSGMVVVHRDLAVTCTSDTCPRDLRTGVWFGMHSRFVRCPESLAVGRRCPDCGFESPMTTPVAPMQPSRFAGHLRRGHGNRDTDPSRRRAAGFLARRRRAAATKEREDVPGTRRSGCKRVGVAGGALGAYDWVHRRFAPEWCPDSNCDTRLFIYSE